jgi:hypothetical protein
VRASGTVQFEITIGRLSTVTSRNHTSWRGSLHSLVSDSFTIMTMSRSCATLSLANSAMRIFPSGNTVCAPVVGDMSSCPITG